MKSASESSSTMNETAPAGECLVTSLSERDTKKLASCFDPNVRFRALVPSGISECRGSDDAAALMQSWFEEAERLQLIHKEIYSVSHRLNVSYRFREFYSDGETQVIEQHAYCDIRNGLIESISIVCSGHLPDLSGTTSDLAQHKYDAGDLGCGSGLPQEFRHQISSIPVGQVLEIVARDPSAKEDLPALARLLGHQVLSVKTFPKGIVVVTVQRGR